MAEWHTNTTLAWKGSKVAQRMDTGACVNEMFGINTFAHCVDTNMNESGVRVRMTMVSRVATGGDRHT